MPETAAVSVSTGVPEQLAVALGPYKLNVIIPVGDEPPDNVAVSDTVVLPTGPPGLGVVTMAVTASGLKSALKPLVNS